MVDTERLSSAAVGENDKYMQLCIICICMTHHFRKFLFDFMEQPTSIQSKEEGAKAGALRHSPVYIKFLGNGTINLNYLSSTI